MSVLEEKELLAIEQKWLQMCGYCDAGLPILCTHPDGDYRPVMLRLLHDLRAYRADRDRVLAELQAKPVSAKDRRKMEAILARPEEPTP